jgi:ubiquitin carboxyl-terminal hydrolase L3
LVPYVSSNKIVAKCLIKGSENNPEVMTRLAHRLGLSPELSFHEPYSLTEPELTALVPRPVYALLFLYPETALAEKHDAPMEYNGSGPDEPVLWFQQTIGHACGLIGLLHCLTNGEATKHIIPGSDLDKLMQQAIALKPTERADLLYTSDILEKAHKEAAQTGDSRAPTTDEPVDYAFTAFVKGKDSHLWLMEGWKKGPIDRGLLDEDEDVFSPKALEMGPLKVINSAKASEGRFSCIVLTDTTD